MVSAQGTETPISENVKKQVEVLKSADLNLTPVQLNRATIVLVAEENKMERTKKMVEAGSPAYVERMKIMKEIMVKNIKGVMTPLQIEKFDAAKLADKL